MVIKTLAHYINKQHCVIHFISLTIKTSLLTTLRLVPLRPAGLFECWQEVLGIEFSGFARRPSENADHEDVHHEQNFVCINKKAIIERNNGGKVGKRMEYTPFGLLSDLYRTALIIGVWFFLR